VGEVGNLERADEVRLEMVLPRHALDACIAALRAAHPYEEPAFDALPLVTEPNNTGLGRLGHLAAAVSLNEFAALVEQRTGAQHLRLVGDLNRRVQRVALVGGSGASLIADAARAGADVYVTADLKHHDALLAQRLGLALVDPGHGATEQFTVGQTAAWLRRSLPELRVVESTVPVEPFTARGDR
jgi:putative NIF3 family GTP cyclohydrolase 1 type 2